VTFTDDGDCWINIYHPLRSPLRARTMLGGGKSPLVANALKVLGLAIKLDAENDNSAGPDRDGDKAAD